MFEQRLYSCLVHPEDFATHICHAYAHKHVVEQPKPGAFFCHPALDVFSPRPFYFLSWNKERHETHTRYSILVETSWNLSQTNIHSRAPESVHAKEPMPMGKNCTNFRSPQISASTLIFPFSSLKSFICVKSDGTVFLSQQAIFFTQNLHRLVRTFQFMIECLRKR